MADKRQRLILDIVANGSAQLLGDLKNIQDLLTAHTKAAQESGRAITDAIAKENQAVAELIKQQNELQKVANETRNKQLASQAESTKAAQDARAAIQAQTQAIKDSNAQYGAMKDQLSGLVGLAASVFSINAIKNYATEVIDAKTKVDLFSLSLTSLLGNKKKADEIAAQVFEIAKKSPFEVEQLIAVTQKLKAMGVETDKLIPYIKALGDISAFVGTDKLPFMAKAMVDVQNKGKLMAQEINQFSNAGVPLFDLLAKSMGKTKEAVIEMAKEHTISFAMVEKAILGATEKGGAYYNGMANSAKSLGGQVSNLSDLFFLGKAKLGDYFENGLQKGITIIGDFLKATVGSNGAIQRTISTLETGLAIWLSYKVAVIATNASLKANEASTLAEMGAVSASNAVKRTTIATLYQQIAGNTALTTAQRSKMMGQILDMEAEVAANAVKVTGVGITGSLTGAIHGLNLAIKANPWGFLISAVGLAYAAFTSYKALTQEVSAVESEHLTMLNKTKVAFESELTALSNTIVGTKDRREAVAKIQLQYPDYLKNINLEFATQQDLAKVLARVNGQLERKIQLAAQDARTEQFRQTSIELYNKQGDVVDKLRDKYGDLSKSYIDNASFLAAVNKEATKLTTNTHVGMGQYVKTVNTDALELIGTYKNLGAEIQKSNAKIQGSLQQTNLLTANDMKATANQFAKDLKERQFDLKRLRDIGVLNDTKYKEQWNLAVADYKKDIKSLSNEQIKTNETTLNKVGDDTKKANKAKAETHSATAKEINLIEAQSNAKRLDMSKQLSKDELKVLQDLAKAEYAVDVEKVNKKYKTAKDGKEKISAEIIKLDQILFDKLEKIDKEQSKKKEAENERRTKYKETELEKETRKELAELEEKLLKQAKKELTEAEKLDDQLEKLNKEYRESQARLEDAQNLKRELATAKTATERYAITVKYGKKTNDELLALEIVRMQKEQKLLNDHLIFLAKNNLQNTDDYRQTQEKYLKLSTDINNKISGVISKQADEQLKIYGKFYQFYEKYLQDTFRIFDKTFADIQTVYKSSMDSQLKSLNDTYERQYKFLGDDYAARLVLTEDYANKQNALLTDQAKQDRIFAAISAITQATNDAFTRQKALNEQYQAGTITEYQKTAGTVSNIVQMTAGVISQVLTTSYNDELKIIDAKKQNNDRYYEDSVRLAENQYNEKIKFIDNEEKAHSNSIDRQLSFELRKIDVLSRLAIDSNDKQAQKDLADLIKNKEKQLGALKTSYDKEIEGAKFNYESIKNMDMGLNSFIEENRLIALKALHYAKQAEIEEAEAAGLSTFNIEEKYNALKTETNKKYDKEQTDNLILRQGLQKTAKEDFEKEKAEITERYESQKNAIIDKAETDKQDILDKSEKRKGDIIANAEIAKTMAIAQNEEKRTKIVQDALDAKLQAQYEFDTLQYEAKKKLNVQQGELEVQRLEAERGVKKAQIALSLALAAAQLFAINPILGIVGAIAAIGTGAALFDKIDNSTGLAQHQVNQQIQDAKNAPAPVAPTKAKPVVYIRTNEQNAQSGGLANFDGAGNGIISGVVPDFNQNPQAANNHEAPIDYINWQGAKLGVYGWDDVERNGVVYKVPDFFRKYFQGSDYVERGQFKQGIDQIPAMVNEGERIIPTEQNQLIGGKNTTNEQLIKKVQLADFVSMKMPNLMQMFDMPRLKMDSPSGGFSDANMIKAMERMEKAIIGKKTSNVNINVDKYKIDVEEQMGDSLIRYRNATYNRNN